MLVCSHCQFENPLQNRFCQNCGAPLQLWQAVVWPQEEAGDQARTPEQTAALGLDKGAFLDEEQRYQIHQAGADGGNLAAVPHGYEVVVLDHQPGEVSPLIDIQDKLDLLSPETVAARESDEVAGLLEAVPPLAWPYLQLRSQLFSTLPTLHDTWEQAGHTAILLEDRSAWPLFADAWADPDTEPLQQIHWLHEMTHLWSELAPWQGQGSLLVADNLRIDEDQLLCLRRLYTAAEETARPLRDLGLLWQLLLPQAATPLPASLSQLAADLGTGLIQDTATLDSRLSEIAYSLEDHPPTSGAPQIANADPDQGPAGAAAQPPPAQADSPETAEDWMEPLDTEGSDGFDIDDLDALDRVDDEDEDDERFDGPTVVLPMKLVGLHEAGATHVGHQRDHNEDSFCIDTTLKRHTTPSGETLSAQGLYLLCDGMGGHAGGEVASALAVETLRNYFAEHWPPDQMPSEEVVTQGIFLANEAIYAKNQQNDCSGSGRMGTTLVLVLLQNTQAIAAHVGDSRLYRYTRRLGLQQITVDHEVGQREIQRGVEPAIAYARPDAYQLTQALGPRNNNNVRPGISFLTLSEDTLFLLCSDGLSDNDLVETYAASHIEPLIKTAADLEDGVAQLIDLANTHNGHDNITVVAVRARVRPNLSKVNFGQDRPPRPEVAVSAPPSADKPDAGTGADQPPAVEAETAEPVSLDLAGADLAGADLAGAVAAAAESVAATNDPDLIPVTELDQMLGLEAGAEDSQGLDRDDTPACDTPACDTPASDSSLDAGAIEANAISDVTEAEDPPEDLSDLSKDALDPLLPPEEE
jgi:protein phosphatase